eukprot:scaffold44532_cov85-Phaeocystis_antarctica.AAC.1
MAASPGGEWRQSLGLTPDSGAPTASAASKQQEKREIVHESGDCHGAVALPPCGLLDSATALRNEH